MVSDGDLLFEHGAYETKFVGEKRDVKYHIYQSNLSVPGLSDAWDRKVQALIVPAASR